MSEQILFKRFVEVKIGNYFCTNNNELKIKFTIPFDDNTEPNESTIEIYNLKDSTISAIKQNDICTVTAGYEGDTGVILNGRVSLVETNIARPDKITKIYVLDSEDLSNRTIKSKSYASGTKASSILKDLASKLGLPISAMKLPTDIKYSKGWTVEGKIAEEMSKVAKHCGASLYINKGNLYIRPLTEGDNTNFTLSVETGLIDIPSEFTNDVTIDQEDEQYIATQKGQSKIKTVNGQKVIEEHGYNIKSLLQHRITTASLITLKSNRANGKFRVRSGQHTFDETFTTEMTVLDRGEGV